MNKNNITSSVAFKRLAIGQRFRSRLGSFRKAGANTAFELLPSGRGRTHARVTISRSLICQTF